LRIIQGLTRRYGRNVVRAQIGEGGISGVFAPPLLRRRSNIPVPNDHVGKLIQPGILTDRLTGARREPTIYEPHRQSTSTLLA
jgi:hypothetical protein